MVDRLSILLARLREAPVVIDADVHATDLNFYGPRTGLYYHGRPLSPEEILNSMDAASVAVANIWQNPAATRYPGPTAANTEALLYANQYIARAAQTHPSRFIASGWTDPHACGISGACEIATICVRELGFAIVKMNPAQNRYPIDSPAVLTVVDHIASLGAIPAFHYGADIPFTPPIGLSTVAAHIAPHPVLAVHMGVAGAGYIQAESHYHASIALGLEHPNIHYILSALRDTYIERAILEYSRAGQLHRLFCASDAPYGLIPWNFGGFRALFSSLHLPPAHTDGLLGNYFARFVLDAYHRLGIE